MISHIWNLKYGTNANFHRKENHGHEEETRGCWGVGGSGMDWEFGVNRCKLQPMEWISTGSYAWSLVMEHDNVRKKNVYMYV